MWLGVVNSGAGLGAEGGSGLGSRLGLRLRVGVGVGVGVGVRVRVRVGLLQEDPDERGEELGRVAARSEERRAWLGLGLEVG